MKELKELYKSDSYKNGELQKVIQVINCPERLKCTFLLPGVYEVDLVNDSLYEWNVKLKK